MFHGVLDVGAKSITEGMAVAAANALAGEAVKRGLTARSILPKLNDREVPVRVAVAAGLAAQAEGVARLSLSAEELEQMARARIEDVRKSMELLMHEGLIAAP
jgi:malate dehydrogenase (oxaloacetate-decarboxylating)